MKKKKEAVKSVNNADAYIRLDEESLKTFKKTLLEIKASSVNMQLIAEKLKKKVKDEVKQREIARRQMKEAYVFLNNLKENLPKIELEEQQEKIPEQSKKGDYQKETELTKQLEDIRKKINMLQR